MSNYKNMEGLQLRLRGRLELTTDLERIKKLVLSNGQSEFGQDDTCCYGDFALLNRHPEIQSSIVIVVNEPEGVFVQYQEEPNWKPKVLIDSKNKGIGMICDEGGQCTEIPARYFVSGKSAWKAVEHFIEKRVRNQNILWSDFDLKAAEAEAGELS